MFSVSRENTSLLAKWWRNVDKEIFFSFVILFLLGLFFSFTSTSSVVAEKMNKETYFFFIKHLVFVFISLILILFISIQQKKKIINFLPFLFLISIILLFLVPILGVEIKGAKRWMDLPLLPRFQPVELAKPLFVVFVARIIVLEEKTKIYKRYFYSFLVLLAVVIFLINQPDIGQTLLLTLVWLAMIFVSGFNMGILLLLGIIIFTIFGLLIFLFPGKFGYIFLRVKNFLEWRKKKKY